jgi:hypothetical protein
MPENGDDDANSTMLEVDRIELNSYRDATALNGAKWVTEVRAFRGDVPYILHFVSVGDQPIPLSSAGEMVIGGAKLKALEPDPSPEIEFA